MKTESDPRIVDKIFKYADLENKQVLEVGCGDGRISSLMIGKAGKLIAVDPDEEKIRAAGKVIPNAEFPIGSGENLEFSEGCFDIVIFTLSLHHQDSNAALREAKRVRKEEGKT
jgi:ubiquinone/menaquinone biosynthesis C-methylase UbiE